MIRHVVTFKFKSEVPMETRKAFIAEARRLIDIEVVRALTVAENIVEAERNSDFVLLADFDSLADLQVYAKHPDHQPVLQRVPDLIEKVAVVDYEF